MTKGAAERRLLTVRFLGVPARLQLANQAHLQDLLHELRIVRAGEETGQTSAGADLAELMWKILEAYGSLQDATRDEAERAVREGRERIDLEIEVPPEAAEDATTMFGLLQRADDFCRDQQLLTLAAPPEVAALRRWLTDQIAAQITRGESPSPCPL